MTVKNIPRDISAGDYIIVDTEMNIHFALTEEIAENIIESVVSDLVYQELGGDDEFLYDDNGDMLPDEEIIDSVIDILKLGEEAHLCYIDENENWAYLGDGDGKGELRLSVYKLI